MLKNSFVYDVNAVTSGYLRCNEGVPYMHFREEKNEYKKGKTGSEVKWDIEQQLKDRNFTRSSKSVE